MSMWQTSLLEFNCVNICNCNIVSLITVIHAIVKLVLSALGVDNLHASTLPKTFLSFKSDISCSSLSLKILVTMSGQSCAVKLKAEADH